MDNQNFRNMILAGVITLLIFMGWDWGMRYFYPNAGKKPAAVASAPATPGALAATSAAPGTTAVATPGTAVPAARDLNTALSAAPRVPIDAPGLSGSINLTGGLVDDLVAHRHAATIEKTDDAKRIFSPAGTPKQYFAQFGWAPADGAAAMALPTATTVWTVPAGAKLTPQSPVTLSWTNPTGQTFSLTYAIDADYMLTVTQGVSNAGAAPIAVKPVALINRIKPDPNDKEALDTFNVHSGPFGAYDGVVDFGTDYSDVDESQTRVMAKPGKPDWLGFTDIYWMSTLIPEKEGGSADFRSPGKNDYLAVVSYPQVAVAAGQQAARTTRLFAGAKETSVLDKYEAAGIPQFGLAIDWGWFRWFEKPIFGLLSWLFQMVGNFGVAIILLTVIVRIVMFPIAQKQFASMAAMKAIQPKMKALQERYKDDRAKQQEEVMALYKKEGVNPLAGCLPIFLQIPVFFALYKVLILSVEMRHQPFFGWIKDLSAPDPAHLLNLFGLLNFNVPAMLGIGVLAILLGVTMHLQFKLNPAQMDPTQQQIFAMMPWLMMFIMAPFAAGLLIYWITNNVLTIGQQAYLYSKHPQLAAEAEKDVTTAKKAKAKG